MSPKKAAIFLFLAALIIASVFWGWKMGGKAKVTIVNLANFQSQLAPFEMANQDGIKQKRGGAAYIGPALKQIKEEYPGTLVVESGDWVSGLMWRQFGGEPEFRVAGILGLDVGVLGNQEFNHGQEHLTIALAQWASFPLLSSNLHFADQKLNDLSPNNLILETGPGLKVGFFGLTTLKLTAMSRPGPGVGLQRDLAEEARMQIADLKANGAKCIIMLSHCDLETDLKLASEVRGIGAIINGMVTDGRNEPIWVKGPGGWQTAVCLSDSMGRSLSVLNLALHWGRPDPEKSFWELRQIHNDGPEDERITRLVELYNLKLGRHLEETIGQFVSNVNSIKSTTRSTETALGDFLADAIRWRGKAQIALINAGAIRGDRIFPAGPFSAKTILEILPFNDMIWIKKLTGAQVRETLELSASALIGPEDDYIPEERIGHGGFLHISGLKVHIDLGPGAQPALLGADGRVSTLGNRVKDILVFSKDSWQPLDESETYNVAFLGFTANGGDKYLTVKEAHGFNTQIIDSEAVMDYLRFRRDPLLNLKVDGRQKIESNPKP